MRSICLVQTNKSLYRCFISLILWAQRRLEQCGLNIAILLNKPWMATRRRFISLIGARGMMEECWLNIAILNTSFLFEIKRSKDKGTKRDLMKLMHKKIKLLTLLYNNIQINRLQFSNGLPKHTSYFAVYKL